MREWVRSVRAGESKAGQGRAGQVAPVRSVVHAPAGKALSTILMLSMDMIAEVFRQVW